MPINSVLTRTDERAASDPLYVTLIITWNYTQPLALQAKSAPLPSTAVCQINRKHRPCKTLILCTEPALTHKYLTYYGGSLKKKAVRRVRRQVKRWTQFELHELFHHLTHFQSRSFAILRHNLWLIPLFYVINIILMSNTVRNQKQPWSQLYFLGHICKVKCIFMTWSLAASCFMFSGLFRRHTFCVKSEFPQHSHYFLTSIKTEKKKKKPCLNFWISFISNLMRIRNFKMVSLYLILMLTEYKYSPKCTEVDKLLAKLRRIVSKNVFNSLIRRCLMSKLLVTPLWMPDIKKI